MDYEVEAYTEALFMQQDEMEKLRMHYTPDLEILIQDAETIIA